MLKTIFFIKSAKVRRNGESPIYCRVTYKGNKIEFATGKYISHERWDFTNKLRNPLKLEKERIIKNNFELLLMQIDKLYNSMIKSSEEIDLEIVKAELTGNRVPVKVITVLQIFEEHNKYFLRKAQHGDKSMASYQKYERSKKLMQQYILKYYNTEDFEVKKMTNAFIHNLESYLKYESVYKGKVGIANNSVVKYFSNYLTVFNYGIKMDLIEKNPFIKFDGKTIIKDATFLSQDELDRIEQKEFSADRLNRVKDTFLFSCYTGYAPVDAAALTTKNLIKDSAGYFWIQTDRTKTGTRANVPVLAPVQRIIDKYKSETDHLIPALSNQKMNAYLKEIADICSIDKHLTWYVARHTFATTVTLGNGVAIENVASMMGHTNLKQTQHYAKVLDKNVLGDMEKIMKKFL